MLTVSIGIVCIQALRNRGLVRVFLAALLLRVLRDEASAEGRISAPGSGVPGDKKKEGSAVRITEVFKLGRHCDDDDDKGWGWHGWRGWWGWQGRKGWYGWAGKHGKRGWGGWHGRKGWH